MAEATGRRIRIGVDTGGTFTDVVAFDEDTGELLTTKTPSTPSNPAEGFLTGVARILDQLGATGPDVTAVCHGTTVATNQLLEGKVDELGLITTEGYEFLLEIARQSVPAGYGNSYFWVKPPRIVPADLVKTVGGRIDFEGNEIRPFDEDAAVRVARWFRQRRITTIGISLLHSYANDTHELRMRDVLRREHPEAVVSVSSEVLREYREYERSMTTLVDAAVKPLVSRYVANIAQRLDQFLTAHARSSGGDTAGGAPRASWSFGGDTGGGAPRAFYIMKSNGGVLSADEVVHQPITTVLSGPAAGALGAALIARKAGFDKVLTCDGGGTSTDVTVVLDGEPTLTTEGTVGAYPSKIPMIDVVTVGAGGGSIAWLSPEGALKVGPRSAGADPGPLCYGKGGTEPTVTDAHVLLGRIPPHLLGGEIPLDVEAARDGLHLLADRLGIEPDHCAAGILEISAWNQANALRQVSVKRGLDVRDFMLATFGGSGSLLACRLIDILDLSGVVVPHNPGNVSAFGLLTVDVRNDYVQTAVAGHTTLDHAAVQEIFDELTDRATRALDAQGFPRDAHRYARSVDLRYLGQAFEVRVPAPGGPVDEPYAADVADRFHAEHRALYGYDFADDPRQQVEWVNLRVTGVGPITRPELPEIASAASHPDLAARARPRTRPVCFDAAAGYTDADVYWRPDLLAGDALRGPAIVEEFGSTVPVHPGFGLRVDRYGNLVLTREA
ncbi:MAG TPA: hydantoinase/oxoprolinase family protein [Intrasporangium sp.]|uniref:hydantoinase/oxoprolinase family protein n=1 Tax=Intrasporangium sp. TaxID=1925024 RepID=UPI002D794BA5|nr:hydantoinase/oxoprolinase family protein [Intrasporangium sp.]HET7399576.1 hydantoinase/oxoprolinase family protein [Intrasporangium sp.]